MVDNNTNVIYNKGIKTSESKHVKTRKRDLKMDKAREFTKKLEEKYMGHRFNKRELEQSFNFHFNLKGKKKMKLTKEKAWLPSSDNMMICTFFEDGVYYDITVFYLKTNFKGLLYITEIIVDSEEEQ